MSSYLRKTLIFRHAQTARNLEIRKALRSNPHARGWLTRRGMGA